MSFGMSSATAAANTPTHNGGKGFADRWGAITALLVFLLAPLLVLLLFSFSSTWVGTVLPGAFTLEHWVNSFTNGAVIAATGRSLFLTVAVTLISIALVVPAAYVSVVAYPKVRPLIHAMAVVPFALPWIVIAAGMQLTVKEIAPQLFGTPLLLILVLTGVSFPYMYWAVENALITNNAVQLSEAAKMSGAGQLKTLWRVMIPASKTGVMVGSLLVASSAFGEFAITQTLMGGNFETLPIWSVRMFGGRIPGGENNLAVVSIATFILLFIISVIISRAERRSDLAGAPKAPKPARKA